MSGKFNNRVLLIIFGVLAAIFVITRFTTVKRSNQTLRSELVTIDTSRVTGIKLYPRADRDSELIFRKEQDGWTVTGDGVTAAASEQSVRNALTELHDMEAEQLVARSPEKWAQYQVNDSLGTRLVLLEGEKTLLDLMVGRFTYQPVQGGNQMYGYGQNQGTAYSYVRLSDEEEVYSVEGFLSMSLNQPFSRWRDQTLTRLNTGQLQKIIYDYPADTGFVAERSQGKWMVAGLMADSASMERFVNGLARRTHNTFADDFKAPGEADFTMTLEGENMQTHQVKGYAESDSLMIVESTYNPGAYFRLELSDVRKDLFPSAGRLIGGENEEAPF